MSIPFTQILLPLDGSRLAEVAVPVAAAFAQAQSATISLLHVVEADAPAKIHGDRHLQSESEAFTYLASVAETLRAQDIAVETVVTVADSQGVADTIDARAEKLGSDLVVLATHGEGGIRDLLFGRVAQKVIHHATRPLVLVPASSNSATYECETLVLPLDGSDDAEIALPVAQALIDLFHCRLVLTRVVPTPKTLQGGAAAVATLLPSATATLLRFEVDEAGRYLNEIARQWFPGQHVVSEVRRGQVGNEIEQTLMRYGADLAVMSTHGRGGLTAFLEGSIGQHLLSRAVCPIVVLRFPE